MRMPRRGGSPAWRPALLCLVGLAAGGAGADLAAAEPLAADAPRRPAPSPRPAAPPRPRPFPTLEDPLAVGRSADAALRGAPPRRHPAAAHRGPRRAETLAAEDQAAGRSSEGPRPVAPPRRLPAASRSAAAGRSRPPDAAAAAPLLPRRRPPRSVHRPAPPAPAPLPPTPQPPAPPSTPPPSGPPRPQPSRIVQLVELGAYTAHRYGVIGWIVCTIVQGLYIPLMLPTEPLDLAAGVAYGVAACTAAGSLAKTIGAYLCLVIGRRLGPRLGLDIPVRMRSRLTLFRKQPIMCICLTRLAPVPPGIKNYALALVPPQDLPLVPYMVASAVIGIPLTLPWCAAGHAAPRLADALEKHGFSGDSALWGVVAIPVAVVLLRKLGRRCRCGQQAARSPHSSVAEPALPAPPPEQSWPDGPPPADDISLDDFWDLSSPPVPAATDPSAVSMPLVPRGPADLIRTPRTQARTGGVPALLPPPPGRPLAGDTEEPGRLPSPGWQPARPPPAAPPGR
eukprot:TRINITY_DN16645_c0_g1_i1.p1 TRINITY_DN16645_c0_g1~~TRINITY_DN16645_c0_g1_i1.p1  ORF type:complete len:509 (+),score=87.18 TRINITY_DN16645_c0_g1_i1:90-1616(+)